MMVGEVSVIYTTSKDAGKKSSKVFFIGFEVTLLYHHGEKAPRRSDDRNFTALPLSYGA
jgi:hypothetical protein